MTLKLTRKKVSKIHKIVVKSIATIWRWSQRFGKKATSIINGLADLLHADETEIETYRNKRHFWLWAIKCPRTKCIVMWHLSGHRTLHDAKLLLWEARRRFSIGHLPRAIPTDGFPGGEDYGKILESR